MILKRALRSALMLLAALTLFAMPVEQARAVITFQSAGAFSDSNIVVVNPAYPAGVASGDLLILLIGMKPAGAVNGAVPTPEGWTLITTASGGGYGGVPGGDTGDTHVFAFSRIADGTETGTLDIRLVNNNVAWTQIYRLTNATMNWSVAGTTGQRTTAPTAGVPFNVTMAANPGVAGGDFILGAMVIPTDVTTPAQFTNESFSQTGVVYGAATEIIEPDSNTGNDIGGYVIRASVTSGTGSAAPVITATAAATITNVRGPLIFIRVRATGAITFQTPGAISYWVATVVATNVCAAHPASVAAGDLLVTVIGMKPSAANSGSVTTPPGWTAVSGGSLTGAGGYGATLGADTGNTNVFSYYRVATGIESGERCFDLTNNGVAWAQMYRYTSTTGTWLVAGTTGSDANGTAPNDDVSIAMSSNPGVTVGDHILGAMVIPTDATSGAQFTAETFSQTGATFSAAVEISEPFSTTGNDIGGFVARSTVTAGVGTANPTLTATAASASPNNVRGPGVFIRIRDDTAYTQAAFRFYEDGTEAGSTATAAQDTNISRNISDLQLRLRIQEINGLPGAATDDFQLQYSKNAGAYANVTGASTNVRGFNSTSLTDGGATTNRLGAGTGSFVAGVISEDGLADNDQITASNFTEHLFTLTLVFADLANGDTLDFRLLRNGAVVAAYIVTPRITVTKVIAGSFNAVEVGTNAATGIIMTKVAGTAFSLDVVAISGGAQQAGFTSPVTVELLGNTSITVPTDAQNCPTSFTSLGTVSPNPVIAAGRVTVLFPAVADAWRDVRVRVRWPTTSPSVTWCSSDRFAIRPSSLGSFAVTDTDSDTTGTPGVRALNLLTFAAATPVHKAGRPVSVRATAVNSAAVKTANYVGAPTKVLSACVGAACTSSFGTLTLTTTFAAGELASDAASYDNVGSFTLQLQDTDFASVDAGDTTGDCSLTPGPLTGRFICSAPLNVGRFVPDHLTVSLNTPTFGVPSWSCGFTYIGQKFGYTLAPSITVTGRAFGGAATSLYTGAWFRISNSSLTGKAYTNLAGTLDTSGISGSDPAIDSALRTLTFNSGTGFLFTRATTPVSPFDAEISLAINVIDDDAVAYGSNPARFSQATAGNGISFPAGKNMRYGRLRLLNATGSALTSLPVPMAVQYWDGSKFVPNADDSCTTIATPGNVTFPAYTGGLSAANLSSPTHISSTGDSLKIKSGAGYVLITKPSSTATGTATVSVDLGAESKTYLQGNWGVPPSPTYNVNPSARIGFGMFGRQPRNFIFNRENY